MSLGKFGVKTKNKSYADFVAPKEIKDKKISIDIENIENDLTLNNKEYFLPWFLKYKVKKFDDLLLTNEIKQILDFIKAEKYDKSILLYGRPGSGKTTTLNLIGEKLNFEVVEMNASDARNKKSINEFLNGVIKQKSLISLNKKKLIIIDEVDGISGTYDRGGLSELLSILKITKYPIIFCANNQDIDKLKPLRKKCKMINFENHSGQLLLEISKKIFDNEKIKYELNDLKNFIEERKTFDIRGFINDIQSSCLDGIFLNDSSLEIRDYKKKIDEILYNIYYENPTKAKNSFAYQDVNLDDLFLFLEENSPRVLNEKENYFVFNELSKANLFKSKIRKWQYYRYLVYVSFYLTYAVSTYSKNAKKQIEFKRNNKPLEIWIYKRKASFLQPRTKIQKKKLEKAKFVELLAKKYSNSVQGFIKNDFPYFLYIYKNNKNFRDEINSKYEIDENILINF